MKIYFAIPTWNRSEQLRITLLQIISGCNKYRINAEIIVSDNCSTDGTNELLIGISSIYKNLKFHRTSLHISGMENYQEVLELCRSKMEDGDFVWSVGDDDDLNFEAIKSVYEILMLQRPYFASVGNTKLPPHRGEFFTGTSVELAYKFGFFLTFGFISQCIFSKAVLTDINDTKTMSEKFKNDSYSHASSVLFLGRDKKCTYIDAPVATWRDYPSQAELTQARWSEGKVFDGIFNFIDSLEYLTSTNVLSRKLNCRFFRFWRWHFWDQLVYDASSITLQNPSAIEHNMWGKIYQLTGFLEDRELAKKINLNTDLFRFLLASQVDRAITKAFMDKLHSGVYNSYLGDSPSN
jgi:glycosyltransferase involved in cell wall biosynthesis